MGGMFGGDDDDYGGGGGGGYCSPTPSYPTYTVPSQPVSKPSAPKMLDDDDEDGLPQIKEKKVPVPQIKQIVVDKNLAALTMEQLELYKKILSKQDC